MVLALPFGAAIELAIHTDSGLGVGFGSQASFKEHSDKFCIYSARFSGGTEVSAMPTPIAPNPKSTASIAGHPLHPMFIPFPIAFFVFAFLCDLAFWRTGEPFWATASLWLLGAGLVMAALAAVFGLIDFLGEPRIRALNDAWWHAGGNVLAVLIALYNWYTRYTTGEAAILPTGLLLSLIVVLIIVFTGWKGWNLVYRYRVAVADR